MSKPAPPRAVWDVTVWRFVSHVIVFRLLHDGAWPTPEDLEEIAILAEQEERAVRGNRPDTAPLYLEDLRYQAARTLRALANKLESRW